MLSVANSKFLNRLTIFSSVILKLGTLSVSNSSTHIERHLLCETVKIKMPPKSEMYVRKKWTDYLQFPDIIQRYESFQLRTQNAFILK